MTTTACHQARLLTTRASSPVPQFLTASTISRSLPLRPASTPLKRPFHSSLRRQIDSRDNNHPNADDASKSNATSAAKNGKSKDSKADKKTDKPSPNEPGKSHEGGNNEPEPPSSWKLSQQKRRARGTAREGWLVAPASPDISDELLDEVLVPNEKTPRETLDNVSRTFLEKAVTVLEEKALGQQPTPETKQVKLEVEGQGGRGGSGSPGSFPNGPPIGWQDIQKVPMKVQSVGKYKVSKMIMGEIEAMVAGGLTPPSSRYIDTTSGKKPHIMLHCPQDGGFAFLDAVVKHVSQGTADLVVLDAQRIAREAEKFHQGDFTTAHNALWTLGYATHAHLNSSVARSEFKAQGYFEDAEEPEEYEENASTDEPLGFPKSGSSPRFINFNHATDFVKFLSGGSSGSSGGKSLRISRHTEETHLAGTTAWIEALLDKVVERRRAKDAAAAASKEIDPIADEKPRETASSEHNIIVQVSDFALMFARPAGKVFIDKLLAVVQKRRKEGQRIIVIGTHAGEDDTRDMTFQALHRWQVDPAHTRLQAVIVPCASENAADLFKADYRSKILDINRNHLESMVRQQAASAIEAAAVIKDVATWMEVGLRANPALAEYVWTYEEIHRLTNALLGIRRTPSPMPDTVKLPILFSALHMQRFSDFDKMRFIAGRNPETAPLLAADEKSNTGESSKLSEEKEQRRGPDLKALRKKCDSYEAKLLNGVVNAADIRTTFSDVHVPPATVDALKTLTTLSLIRPEAFTYGVLASDKIPGLLLYGPPGTGKTLLAKAVAKESGATVLEVAGSDVYEMYVGEGEKNIRAIFSLAKKLSPCVIFIDEADAIFGSRNSSTNRGTHRELINQFLREWDGMHNSSAFIMVATNRPFDLDDAVLRRLPRRILVDLPTEKDRESILNIHLKDEQLDSEVSISDLAAKTPFYSGSDLKNVSVAAALAAVKEENALAAKHEGDEPYVYPAKRTLQVKHFDKALEEISASISEDMNSLTAIRKFDERYGDGAGRKKRGKGLGFGMVKEKERERMSEEDSRVRKLVGN